ncbi:hypothetical protein SASPL_147996 [Salvia splendens]|uniref:Uncharacterized protein n=1 Tax=Salvia splendens TaxID=180675 RepID=A0A8X8W9U4_SALSN|nr:hypothetical protein SASPL_147996 [Salvia splendens]
MARTEYSSEFKNQVVQFIIGKCVNGVPPRGTLKEAQLKFKICRQTTTRYWNAAKKQQANGEVIQLFVHLTVCLSNTSLLKGFVSIRDEKSSLKLFFRPYTVRVRACVTFATSSLSVIAASDSPPASVESPSLIATPSVSGAPPSPPPTEERQRIEREKGGE